MVALFDLLRALLLELREPVQRDDDARGRGVWVRRCESRVRDEKKALTVRRHVVAARLIRGEVARVEQLFRRASYSKDRAGGDRHGGQGTLPVEIKHLAAARR